MPSARSCVGRRPRLRGRRRWNFHLEGASPVDGLRGQHLCKETVDLVSRMRNALHSPPQETVVSVGSLRLLPW